MGGNYARKLVFPITLKNPNTSRRVKNKKLLNAIQTVYNIWSYEWTTYLFLMTPSSLEKLYIYHFVEQMLSIEIEIRYLTIIY